MRNKYKILRIVDFHAIFCNSCLEQRAIEQVPLKITYILESCLLPLDTGKYFFGMVGDINILNQIDINF